MPSVNWIRGSRQDRLTFFVLKVFDSFMLE